MSRPKAEVRFPALEKAEKARAVQAERQAARPMSWDERTLWPAPLRPPAPWFERPEWMAPGTRLTIEPDGRVFGYFYSSGTSMRRSDGGMFEPQPSPTKYKLAHTGQVETDDGETVEVAVLGANGHPDANADATAHYADPSRARALVRVGDDEHGGWFSGAIRPGTTVADVAEMRRCSLSGDWRWRSSKELARLGAVEASDGYDVVGLGLVNVPGLPPVYVEDEHPAAELASVTDLPVPGPSPEERALDRMRGVRAGIVVLARFALDQAHRLADAQNPEVVASLHVAKSALDFVAQLDEITALPEEPVAVEEMAVEEPEVAQA